MHETAHFTSKYLLRLETYMTEEFYIILHLEILDTILLMEGIHIGGILLNHLGNLQEKEATGEISELVYMETCRICTRKINNNEK